MFVRKNRCAPEARTKQVADVQAKLAVDRLVEAKRYACARFGHAVTVTLIIAHPPSERF